MADITDCATSCAGACLPAYATGAGAIALGASDGVAVGSACGTFAVVACCIYNLLSYCDSKPKSSIIIDNNSSRNVVSQNTVIVTQPDFISSRV